MVAPRSQSCLRELRFDAVESEVDRLIILKRA